MEACAATTPAQARGRQGPAHHRRDARQRRHAAAPPASTFDHVAREAGVSRGLLHYYFGSKERLLVEVVRHDCESAAHAHGRAARRRRTAPTRSWTRSCVGLEEFIEDDAGGPVGDLRDAERVAPLRGDPRGAGRALPPAGASAWPSWLRTKEREGVIRLEARPRGGGVDPVLARRRLRHPGAVRPRAGTGRPPSSSACATARRLLAPRLSPGQPPSAIGRGHGFAVAAQAVVAPRPGRPRGSGRAPASRSGRSRPARRASGTSTASSSGWRARARDSLPARAGGCSGKARQSTRGSRRWPRPCGQRHTRSRPAAAGDQRKAFEGVRHQVARPPGSTRRRAALPRVTSASPPLGRAAPPAPR